MQLTLLVMTVIHLTSSQPADESISANNEQVLTQLLTTISHLVTSNAQIHIAVAHLTTANSQLQSAVSQLHRDVTELKTEGRARGELCYFGSDYNFNPNFNFNLVRKLYFLFKLFAGIFNHGQ